MAIVLLRRYWFAEVKALGDAVGSKATIEAMTPYFRNSAIAGTIATRNLLHLDKMGYTELAEMWGLQNTSLGYDHILQLHQDGVIFGHASPCPFFTAPKEICIIFCDVAGNASCELLNPDWTFDLESGDLNSGPNCKGGKGYLHRKSTRMPEGDPVRCLPRVVFEERYSLVLRQNLGAQYYGEFIVITANAAMDALGSKAFSEVMYPAMFEHGKEIASTVLTAPMMKGEMNEVLEAVDRVNQVLKQSGEFRNNSDSSWNKEIRECPFSHASEEFCLMFMNYLDGICKAIDFNSAFSYSRRMTSGSLSCLSEVRVSSHQLHKIHPSQYEEHLGLLKKRLAKGEINEEDYYRLKKLILEDH